MRRALFALVALVALPASAANPRETTFDVLVQAPATVTQADGTLAGSDGRAIAVTRDGPATCATPGSIATADAGKPCVTTGGVRAYGSTVAANRTANPRDFENASWSKTNMSVTKTGCVGIDGVSGSCTILTATGAGGQVYHVLTGLPNTTRTNSLWIKRLTGNGYVDFGSPWGVYVSFKPTTEWVRYKYTAPASTNGGFLVKLWDASDSIAVDFAQTNDGDVPGPLCPSGPCPGETVSLLSAGLPSAEGHVEFSAYTDGQAGYLLDSRPAVGDELTLAIDSSKRLVLASGGASLTSAVLTWPGGAKHKFALDRANGKTSLWRDGVLLARSVAPAWSWGPTLYLGSTAAGASPADATFSNLLATRGYNSGVLAVALGDSITNGNYPGDLKTLLGPGTIMVNAGVDGNHTSEMVTRWTETYRPMRFDTLVFLGGVNDIAGWGWTAPMVYANITQIVNEALADGANVVLLTLLPCTTVECLIPARQAAILALNDLIRATPGVTVADCYAAMGDTATPTALKAAYDVGDHIHPNPTGAAALAACVRGAM
jgi:lysophospholipase L1-like esterase